MSRSKMLPMIFFNGDWMQANDTLLSVLKPGRLRGEGVFETIAVEQGQLCFWSEHWDRWTRGLKTYRLTCPHGPRKLQVLAKEAIAHNHIDQGRLRLCCYRDEGRIYVVIVVTDLSRGRGKKPLAVQVSSFTCSKSRYSHVKSLSYQPYYDAHQAACDTGYDEALLLNPRGYLVEGSTTNVFFVRKGVLCTPAVATGCLNGIVRTQIIKLAPQLGLSVKRGQFRLKQLLHADEAFATNSVIGVRAIHSVNDQLIGEAAPVTQKLQKAYQDLVASQIVI